MSNIIMMMMTMMMILRSFTDTFLHIHFSPLSVSVQTLSSSYSSSFPISSHLWLVDGCRTPTDVYSHCGKV